MLDDSLQRAAQQFGDLWVEHALGGGGRASQGGFVRCSRGEVQRRQIHGGHAQAAGRDDPGQFGQRIRPVSGTADGAGE